MWTHSKDNALSQFWVRATRSGWETGRHPGVTYPKVSHGTVFTMYSHTFTFLIEKDICDGQNISVKLPCVYVCLSSWGLFIFLVFPLSFPIFISINRRLKDVCLCIFRSKLTTVIAGNPGRNSCNISLPTAQAPQVQAATEGTGVQETGLWYYF